MTRALLLALSLAAPAAALEVPDLDSRVIDRAGILEESTRISLVVKLKDFEKATGHQVAVLTLTSLEGEPLEAYALKVARTWGLGRLGVNDGVLFLIVSGDRKVRIEVGHGLEGKLPDVLAGRIIQGVVIPKFREGDLAGGVVAGAVAIMETIDGSYTPPLPSSLPEGYRPLSNPTDFFFGLLATVLGALFFPFILIQMILGGFSWTSGDSDWTSSSRDSSSSGSSSSGSDSFSGGGGSFGGGGASGSW